MKLIVGTKFQLKLRILIFWTQILRRHQSKNNEKIKALALAATETREFYPQARKVN